MEKAVILSLKELREPEPRLMERFDRVYAGDEFCQLKLPTVKELGTLRSLYGGKITLASSVLTDAGMKRFRELITLMESWKDGGEVVVNDIGALSSLAARKSAGIKVSLGRALAANFSSFTASAGFARLFGTAVSSVEVDNRSVLNTALNSGALRLHLHYPFQLLAFSRCCYRSGKLNSSCSSECLKGPRFIEVRRGPLKDKFFLDGNAAFCDNSAMYGRLGGLQAAASDRRVTRLVLESFFFRGQKPAAAGTNAVRNR